MSRTILMPTICLLLAGLSCRSSSNVQSSHDQPLPPSEAWPAPKASHATASEPPSLPQVLQVNGDTITREDILEPLQPKFREAVADRSPEAYTRFVIAQAREELIRQAQDVLLYQEASKDVTDQITEALDRYVDQEIKDRVNRDFGGRQSRFEQYLASQHKTLADEHKTVRRQLLIIKYLQDHIVPKITSPTRQELLNFYNANIDQYTESEGRELFLIDIPKADDEAQARDATVQALDELNQGEPFDEVARTRSKGIHATSGGYWGFVKTSLQGRYAPMSNVLFKLGEHETSDIIETDEAFFIVRAGTFRVGKHTNFQDAQPQLVERFRNYQFDLLRSRLVQSLVEKAVIEPDEELFLKAIVEAVLGRMD